MNKKYQVFISSTFTDMKAERQTAVEAILDAGHIPAGMELFAAPDKKQIEVIKGWIDRSDIFMLILGGRYGSVDRDSGKSYIQLEYEHAVQSGKPYFALYLTDKAIREKAAGPLSLDAVEQNDTKALTAFRDLVKSKLCSEIEDIREHEHVAAIYPTLYDLQLLLVRRGEQLHASRNMARLQNRRYRCLALLGARPSCPCMWTR